MNKIDFQIGKFSPCTSGYTNSSVKVLNSLYYMYSCRIQYVHKDTPMYIYIAIPLIEGSPLFLEGKTICVELHDDDKISSILNATEFYISENYTFTVVNS